MNLILDNIQKSYAGRTVLQNCSCTFDARTLHVLMGPNGSGKSTLLRICSLLEPADSGSVRYSENEQSLIPDITLRRRMTLVLPRTGAFNTSVINNVAYGLAIRGVPSSIANARAVDALDLVGLRHLARRHAHTLSSGEVQRMGLARALVIGPEVLFLDEPTASVDEENTLIIESVIRSLHRDGRTIVVMTTHDRDQVERLAGRLLVLRQGRIETTGRS
jgi:tungstate transport system ATP-binding protein